MRINYAKRLRNSRNDTEFGSWERTCSILSRKKSANSCRSCWPVGANGRCIVLKRSWPKKRGEGAKKAQSVSAACIPLSLRHQEKQSNTDVGMCLREQRRWDPDMLCNSTAFSRKVLRGTGEGNVQASVITPSLLPFCLLGETELTFAKTA